MFKVTKQILTDNSAVFDLFATDEDDPSNSVLLWNAPSQIFAEKSEETLSKVLERFANCGSNKEVIDLAERIQKSL